MTETKDYQRAIAEGTDWQYRAEWPSDPDHQQYYWQRESGPWRKTATEAIADAMNVDGWAEVVRGRWAFNSFDDPEYLVVQDAEWIMDDDYYWDKA